MNGFIIDGMIEYEFQYDISAILILGVILFISMIHRKMPETKNTLFLAICLSVLGSAVTDMLSAVFNINPFQYPLSVQYVVTILYFVFGCSISMFFLLYCLGICGQLKRMKRPLFQTLVFGPYLADLSMIAVSPFWGTVFSYSEEGVYVRGIGVWIMYLLILFHCILGCAVIFVMGTHVPRQKKVLTVSFVFFTLIGVVFQAIYPLVLIQNFSVATGLLLIFVSLQRPEEVLDNDTGFLNHTSFEIMVSRTYQRKMPFSLIVVLIDDFQFFSSAFGVDGMNYILQNIGRFLKQLPIKGSVYYDRPGVFCIWTFSTDEDKLQETVNQIAERFEDNWKDHSNDAKLFVRQCIIRCPDDADSPEKIEEIIGTVATDMRYSAHKLLNGGDIDIATKQRIDYLDKLIKSAIYEDRIDVYYQPLFSTHKNRIVGAEALIRMRDENGNFVSPEEFVPIAERNGQILRLGQYVYENVCRFISTTDIIKYGVDVIDVNLSMAQCMQIKLAGELIETVKNYGISPEYISLEITETAAAHSPEMLLINMEKLSEAGFSFALDDYGSGYANINYIVHLPFSVVKIDKDILWSAMNDLTAKVVLSSSVEMMRKLNKKIVAEGVENKEMADMLTKLNCDLLQGYYYSKPLPQKRFLNLLKEQYELQLSEDMYLDELEAVDDDGNVIPSSSGGSGSAGGDADSAEEILSDGSEMVIDISPEMIDEEFAQKDEVAKLAAVEDEYIMELDAADDVGELEEV